MMNKEILSQNLFQKLLLKHLLKKLKLMDIKNIQSQISKMIELILRKNRVEAVGISHVVLSLDLGLGRDQEDKKRHRSMILEMPTLILSLKSIFLSWTEELANQILDENLRALGG